MKIGIDLSVLQGPHRMRGIGYTAINFMNNLSDDAKKEHSFVFYSFTTEDDGNSPLELIDLSGVDFEVRQLKLIPRTSFKAPRPFGRILNSLVTLSKDIKAIYRGDPRFYDVDNLDCFIQFDQNRPTPKRKGLTTILIAYDIIPLVVEQEYLWSYGTARSYGRSRKAALKHELRRKQYRFMTKLRLSHVDKIIAISEHTKSDLVRCLRIRADRISVCHLGVGLSKQKPSPESTMTFTKYEWSTWGYLPKELRLSSDEKFLLFVGGADPRRRLHDLIAAFNNLRAQGEDVKLIFAGDTMMGAFNVPNRELQNYLKNTSYLDDILFLGFVDDNQRNWLYRHAVAFVYPSIYEGFGLPVLEAMQYGTPVITYSYSSVPEISGNAAMYAKDWRGIHENARRLLHDKSLRRKYARLGQTQAAKHPWQVFTENVLSIASVQDVAK